MWFVGILVGMHVGYTIVVIMRSDDPAFYDAHKGIKKILSILTFPAFISLILWGFFNLPWYVVIIWFLVCALLITRKVYKNIPLKNFFRYKTHFEALMLAFGMGIWLE